MVVAIYRQCHLNSIRARNNIALMAAIKDRDEIQSPAIVRPSHIQDRELTTVAGGPRGWRNVSPLQAAFAKGQLYGGNRKYDGLQRLDAGTVYSDTFALSQSSGRNILDLSSHGRGGGLPYSIAQGQALCEIAVLDSHLGIRDRTIIRKVCGEGASLAEAVALACGPDFAKATLPRFRESLDALIEALEASRRSPNKVRMEILA